MVSSSLPHSSRSHPNPSRRKSILSTVHLRILCLRHRKMNQGHAPAHSTKCRLTRCRCSWAHPCRVVITVAILLFPKITRMLMGSTKAVFQSICSNLCRCPVQIKKIYRISLALRVTKFNRTRTTYLKTSTTMRSSCHPTNTSPTHCHYPQKWAASKPKETTKPSTNK